MKTLCEACGDVTLSGTIKGTSYICNACADEVQTGIDNLRTAGQPVNVRHIAKKMFREKNGSRKYQLEDLPEELWNNARWLAKNNKIPMRELVLLAVHEYIKKRVG